MDEGAANHMRLCRSYGADGLEIFVFGAAAFDDRYPRPRLRAARQTLEASQAVARLHRLAERDVLFLQQNPDAIDHGVFHNDLIALGNRDVVICHERAFAGGAAALDLLRREFARKCGGELRIKVVTEDALPLADAVETCFFNSQLVDTAEGMHFVAPGHVLRHDRARAAAAALVDAAHAVGKVSYVDVDESLRNGGGPACLRLRVVLTPDELAAVAPGCLWDEMLQRRLEGWICRHYRDRLDLDDLRDPRLIGEVQAALDELTRIMGLGPIYAFQRQPEDASGVSEELALDTASRRA